MRAILRRTGLVMVIAGGLAAVAPPAAQALQGPTPGAVSPSKLTLPGTPGSIHGLSDDASVAAFSGQLSYALPIDLPRDAGGFEPQLSLIYLGELGNGPMGIGWTLGEIAVRRSLRLGVPSYTDGDELDLVGVGVSGRLVPTATPGRYVVEGEGRRVRVVKQGDRFEVTDGDGTRYLLGATAAGRVGEAGRTMAWMAESITNTAGRQILLGYDRDQGRAYLREISWGPNRAFRVAALYEGRADVTTSWRSGFEVRTARRLQRIEVHAFGEILRSYQLDYDDGFSLARLRSIRMTGRGGDLALPDLTFTYERPALSATRKASGEDGWVLNGRGVAFLDVDGDGMSDLVRLEVGNHQWKKNLGAAFAPPTRMGGVLDAELEAVQLVDLDGDARPELVRIVDDTWRVYGLVGGNWVSRGSWSGTTGVPLHAPGTAFADLNGDGRIDVVRAGTGGLVVHLGGQGGLGPGLRRPRVSSADVSVEPGTTGFHLLDASGDGLADVVFLGEETMRVFLGRGDGTFAAAGRTAYPWGGGIANDDVRLADLDRDGVMDLVRLSAGYAHFYPGLPSGRFSDRERHLPRPEGVAFDAVVDITDANGNGSQDVVWSSARGLWIMDLAGPTSAGMISEIDNGLGKTTRISYRSSAELSVEAEALADPWSHKLPVAIPVPVRLTVDPGADTPPRAVHYGVRDGFWDGVERRLGGFLQSRVTRLAGGVGPADNQVVETRYHPGLGENRVLRGKPIVVQQMDGAGRLFSVRKSDCEALPVVGLSHVLSRRAVERQVELWELEGVVEPLSTRVTFEFDAEARPRLERNEGRLDLAGDERETERRFESDDVLNVRDRLVTEEARDFSGSVASSSRFYYGGENGQPLPLGTIGKGWPRRTEALVRYPGEADRFVEQSRTDYDACGNPTFIRQAGVERMVSYDSDCLHPLAETLVPDPARPPLVWTMTWDRVFGAPRTLTDPNGDVLEVSYDPLGRETAIGVGGGPPHARFAYDWRPPRPSTTSWVFDGKLAEIGSHPWPSSPKWRQTVSVANGAGEILFTAAPLDTGRFVISDWRERDDRGHTVLVAEPFYAATASPAARDSAARVQTMHHDARDRLDRQTLPNGATRVMTFAAFEQTVSSPDLSPVRSVLDGQGRVMHTERNVDGSGLETVDGVYDAAGRLLSITLQPSTAGGPPVVHSFRHDTLGRLREAEDPDVGRRTLLYHETRFMLLREHVNAGVGPGVPDGQHISFDYDDIGRLVRRGEGAQQYLYTYDDDSRALEAGCRVRSRLAGITEPDGTVGLCYDVLGRQNARDRTIGPPGVPARSASERFELSASGLRLDEIADDGFHARYDYDRAGRTVAIRRVAEGGAVTDLWVAEELDGAGRVARERYGNGVVQTATFDALGLPADVRLTAPGATDLYHVVVQQRTAYGAPRIVIDQIQTGAPSDLDQSQTFTYDGAGRIVEATTGAAGSGQFAFGYRYDRLQNMTFRQVCGPKDLGVLTGLYRYGEGGRGPRQLTSIVPGTAP
jgi:YD repeat-containing protein